MTDITPDDPLRIRDTLMGAGGGTSFAKVRATTSNWPELSDISDEANWGKIWTRPGLTLEERSLITIAMFVTLRQPEYARVHIEGAKRIGISRERVAEAIIHMLFYIGLPSVRDGLRLVSSVYDETDGSSEIPR